MTMTNTMTTTMANLFSARTYEANNQQSSPPNAAQAGRVDLPLDGTQRYAPPSGHVKGIVRRFPVAALAGGQIVGNLVQHEDFVVIGHDEWEEDFTPFFGTWRCRRRIYFYIILHQTVHFISREEHILYRLPLSLCIYLELVRKRLTLFSLSRFRHTQYFTYKKNL